MARELSLIDRQNQASFRDVFFLVPDETAARGQKVAIHEYPNSNKRFAEPLGKIPAIIDLIGIVHGEFYIEDRRSLELVLEEDGPGELVHPIYGPIQVQPGEFTVKSNQRRVGEFIFSMKFYVSEEVTPNPLPATNKTVTDLSEQATVILLDAVENNYAMDFIETLLNVVGNVLDFIDDVNKAIDAVVNPIEAFAASVSTAVAQFTKGVYSIMTTAQGLKENLESVYNSLVQLSLLPGSLSDAWDELINIEKPASAEESSFTTAQRINQSNNNIIIAEQGQIRGLIGGYETAVNTNFNTTDELQDRLDFLNGKFDDFFSIGTTGILSNDQDLRSVMMQLRALATNALIDQKANIWKVVEIDTRKTSMSLLSYKYYGSLDKIDDLIELNPNLKVSFINEQVNALTK